MTVDRSLEADVLRTSECGIAASKRPPSRSLLDPLATDAPWLAAVDVFRTRHPRRHQRIADYERLLAAGEHRRIGEDVLAGRHRPAPPVERWLNKADGRKKRVFSYPAPDELLFRVANALLQPAAAHAASPWCRSFLPGGGARSAFKGVLADPDVAAKASLRLDVRNYFNSIDVNDLVARLPEPFATGPVRALLVAALLDDRVERSDGTAASERHKGVMAGTPLAPLLATLYLRDLDDEVAAWATYARYSDDIVVLAPPADLPALEALVRTRLAERGLVVNESKSSVAAPGDPWDFLGFRYREGAVGLAPHTEHKLKARATRLARALHRWRQQSGATQDRTARAFLRRTNARLYGIPAERADFSWATWFLPMLDSPDRLAPLDAHVQREARYAATGRRTARTRRTLPYAALVDAGHLPLVPAYWALRDGVAAYEALVARRTATPRPGSR
ncbi:MAG TPA: reverse transcriptase domain-containing protein [Acidimicrobiales bacterium]